ncbi:MAG: MRP family ATP-binding protein [Bacteroidetes bacterium HGW-Bacteroidetes-11]|jgi:ATP-binding protein involved in chromosome partitioning|nr:MAG: MRP family ATP-binding protein [Bacteroidetes bacterium HGW-Bacteroidetes-11]
MSITNEHIINALRTVNDPDLHRDLVTLNMIEDVKVDGKKIFFKVVLTTPACPLKDKIKQDCITAIQQLVDPWAEINIEMTSRVTTRRADKQPLLQGVKNIIAVASGKGGVGKSTVAANLAVALGRTGAKVGLIDADIYGPSVPLMFDEVNTKPHAIEKNGKTLVVPIEKHGIKILSVGFFVDPSKALVWRGPMASNALTQLFSEADWGDLDYMVIDMPPGTGDIHLTIVQQLPVTGVCIVTTPQEVALADARKAIGMFTQNSINVPILGLIENMAWFTPAELPDNKYYIFGKDGGKRLAEAHNIPLLGQIPLVQGICESGDNGNPIALDFSSPVSAAFIELAEKTAQQVAIRNATLEATKIVEITK